MLSFANEREMVEIANDSDDRLTVGVFTTNLSRAHQLTRALEAGNVYVNH